MENFFSFSHFIWGSGFFAGWFYISQIPHEESIYSWKNVVVWLIMQLNHIAPNLSNRSIMGVMFEQLDLIKDKLLKRRCWTKRKKVGILTIISSDIATAIITKSIWYNYFFPTAVQPVMPTSLRMTRSATQAAKQIARTVSSTTTRKPVTRATNGKNYFLNSDWTGKFWFLRFFVFSFSNHHVPLLSKRGGNGGFWFCGLTSS